VPPHSDGVGAALQIDGSAVCLKAMFRLPVPDDLHLHLRQGPHLANYARDTAAQFGRALVMPNTRPPISGPAALREYRRQIVTACSAYAFEPLMSFKLAPDHDAQAVHALADAGAVAAKYYPRGATTNSEDGIEDLRTLYPAIEALQERDVILCLHGEDPSAFCLSRETAFLPRLEELVNRFPRLRIVLEHVSTADAVRVVRTLPQTVGATITAHHLVLTLDDLIGDLLNPHHFCKPVVKTPDDRNALREAATSGDRRFFFGSDSAPHRRADKECACGCAGVYTAPVAIAVLAGVFELDCPGAGDAEQPLWVRRLRAFLCENGAAFYRLPPARGELVLAPEEWLVPAAYHDVVPLMAAKRLRWRASRV